MQSSNPVLNRAGVFGGGAQAASARQLQEMYDQPTYVETRGARMTIDDVVAKTAMMFVVLVATGSAAWFLDLGVAYLYGAMVVGLLAIRPPPEGGSTGAIVGRKRCTDSSRAP